MAVKDSEVWGSGFNRLKKYPEVIGRIDDSGVACISVPDGNLIRLVTYEGRSPIQHEEARYIADAINFYKKAQLLNGTKG